MDTNLFRAERFLKVDGDGYFTPSVAQFFKRPEFLAAAFYATLAMTTANDSDMQKKIAVAFLPAVAFGALAHGGERRGVRKAFNSLNNTKSIDTLPDKNTLQTHPVDYSAAKDARRRSIKYGLLTSTFCANSLWELPVSKTHGTFDVATHTFIFGYASYHIVNACIMHRVVKGDWAIIRKPPTREQEFAAEEEADFALPLPQPI